LQNVKNKKITHYPFHPKSNGNFERSHRILQAYVRHYTDEDQSHWDEWVSHVVYMYNTSTHTSTGYTPFELVFSFKSIMPLALQENPSIQYNYDDLLAELKGRLQTAHCIARGGLISHK
jgi:hypothetical protein